MNLSDEEENHKLSLSKFESMLKTNKVFFFDSEEFEDIILYYLDTGKTALAKRALRLSLEQHPKSTKLKLLQVEILIDDDKLDIAEKMLNDLYSLEPTNEEIYVQKASICSKKNLHEKAIEYLNIALKYTDDLADIYNLIGMEYLFLDNLEQAKTNFILCLEEDPEDQSGLYNIVYCFDFLEQNKEAIEYLNQYIEKNPYSEIAWHQIGRLHYNLKEYQEAIRAFNYVTYIDEKFVGAFMERAKTYEKLSKYNEAIESYNQTLELDDASSYALLRIGKCYEKLGNNAMALKFYSRTIHEDPLLDKAWIALTDFYVHQKKWLKAIYCIDKGLSIDSQNSVYWKRYAIINKRIANLEEAEFGYQKAVEFGDNKLETFLDWHKTLVQLGKLENSIEVLFEATEDYPDKTKTPVILTKLLSSIITEMGTEAFLQISIRLNIKNLETIKKLFPEINIDKTFLNYIKNNKNI